MENTSLPHTRGGVSSRGEYACVKVGVGPITRKKRPKTKTKISQDEAGCWLRENGKYTWVKLGVWGDPDIPRKYQEVCQKFYLEQATKPKTPVAVQTLAGLFTAFLEARRPHISPEDWAKCRTIARITIELFPEMTCEEFDCLIYRQVQARVAKRGEETGWDEYITKTGKTARRRKDVWSYWYCNLLMKRLVMMLRWGVGRKLFPVTNLQEIKEVPPIGRGDEVYDLEVREKREAVPDEAVRQTLPFLPPMVADMVRIQRAACMRPSEVCSLTVSDILTAQDGVVCYKRHKTARYHVKRFFCFTPSEMALLRKYCEGKGADEAVFDPKAHKLALWRSQIRKTLTPKEWQAKEHAWAEKLSKGNAFWQVGDYSKNIARALKQAAKAGVRIPHWTPYQLRHASVTENSIAMGQENAAFVAGHLSVSTTARYDHKSRQVAIEAARLRGNEWVE